MITLYVTLFPFYKDIYKWFYSNLLLIEILRVYDSLNYKCSKLDLYKKKVYNCTLNFSKY